MALAEVADRSEVRRIERDNHHEIVPLAAGSRNAPRRIQPACIAMQQKRNHHARIERRLAEPTHIAAHDRLEIQALPHQPNDKPRDVVLGHEVPHIRRQKQRLIDIPGAKVLAHSPSLNQTRWDLNSDYLDRLLAQYMSGSTALPKRLTNSSRINVSCRAPRRGTSLTETRRSPCIRKVDSKRTTGRLLRRQPS